MALEDLKKKFVEQVKLRAYDDKYVDRQEEREILQIAIEAGVSVDSARSALHQVCEREGYVVESAVLDRVKDALDTFAGNDGKIDEKEYKDAVTICQKACQNKLGERECKKMVLQVIDEMGSRIKTGMFSNWIKKAKKEVGMA